MNVIKTDFISKQKRLQNRRQNATKSLFSNYHTISNVIPSTIGFKLPIFNKDNRAHLPPNSKNPFSFSHLESVEPISSDMYTSEATTSKDVLDDDLMPKQMTDFNGSTSLEFQKLLEPFHHCLRDNIRKTYQKCGEESKITTNANLEKEESLKTILQKEDLVSEDHMNPKQKIFDVPQHSSSIQREVFDKYNIFNLPPPKNQKSIEELLNQKCGISEDVVQSPNKKFRTSTSSNLKTPKARKSPKISGSSKTFIASDTGAYILAVTEGRGHARGEVGIAAMDPKRPHLILCQISDSQRYIHSLAKMNVFDFVEVIVPNTFMDTPTKLYSDIRSTFANVTITSVQRRHFSEAIGIDLIKQYCASDSTSIMVLLRDKFYALSAAAALIKYIEFTQNVRLAPRTLKIEYQGMEDTMVIDLDTANLLELVLCVNHPEINLNHNLLGVVKHCHTKGGIRLLRANILQPPCSLAKIESRLDCVAELVANPLQLCALEAAVMNFTNLESLLNLCMHAPQQDDIRVAEYQLKYTLLLKTMLELLPVLRGALQDAKSQFFCDVRENLEDRRYTLILDRILQTVFENAKAVKGSVAAHLHGCFAIKTGINSLLDIAKKTYCEIVQEISDHVTSLRESHGMALRLAFSGNKGFHIQYSLPPGQRNLKESSLPKEFILVQKSKTTFSFYTDELVALDLRSQHVLNEIKLMTNIILFELLTDIRQHIGCLYNLCENIAELDILISFAHVGSGTDYVRPKFGDKLDLKDSRHPILDVVHDGEVVPNDVFAAAEKNFVILTGPNQSGKSIYIRQIALLQIMAQIGCFVPAKEATFRLTDRIFSRIGFDDSIESNACTLIVEMRDIEYLKQNITPRSLVIIDELCRGTSVDEGTSLAFAICEELLDTPAFIFFTTHYLFLTKLEEMYYNVIKTSVRRFFNYIPLEEIINPNCSYHFESKVEQTSPGKPSIMFSHLRKPGPTAADLYGLQVAKTTSFSKDVYEKAQEIAEKLSKERKPIRKVNGLLAKYELAMQLRNELLKQDRSMNWSEMEPTIREFRQMYLNLKMAEMDETSEKSSVRRTRLAMWNKNKPSPCFIPSGLKKAKLIRRNESTQAKMIQIEEKTGREILLKLAVKIKNKYRRLRKSKHLQNLNKHNFY